MSTTNREKRKQAKRKARERQSGTKPKPTSAQLLESLRYLPDDEQVSRGIELVESGKVSRKVLRRFVEAEGAEGLTRERAAFYPDLADRLAADGWAEAAERLYLRFGELPEGGRSTTEVAGRWEKGISVFAGRLTTSGHYVIQGDSWGQGLEFMRLCGEQDRDAFFVTGKRAGKGGAGEPLMKSVESFEPIPDGCLVAIPGGSRSLEMWNYRRFGGLLPNVPELARYFEEAA